MAGTDATETPPLGRGETQAQVAPSPINRTRALADNLISLRTGLALVIALIVQGWRLAGRAPFGIRGQDYLEAFAIGASGQATDDFLIERAPKQGSPILAVPLFCLTGRAKISGVTRWSIFVLGVPRASVVAFLVPSRQRRSGSRTQATADDGSGTTTDRVAD